MRFSEPVLERIKNVHAAYLAIITFRGGVTDEDQRARRLAYIVYGLNHVSHARFQSLSVI